MKLRKGPIGHSADGLPSKPESARERGLIATICGNRLSLSNGGYVHGGKSNTFDRKSSTSFADIRSKMIDMDTIADRLRKERTALGLSQDALGAAAGVRKQTVSAIETGKTKTPDHDTLVAISRRLNVKAHWLLTGRGDRAGGTEPQEAVALAGTETAPGYVRLPLLNMEGEMGYGSASDEANEVVQFLDVAEWWAQQHLPNKRDRIKVISSRGDSMSGVINHGDIVFVDAGITFYEGEGIYVFNWQGRALIKRLAPNLRTGNLQILSANAAAYPPEEITPAEIDSLHIAGKVVAWWTLRKH